MWFVESLIVDVTPVSCLRRDRHVDDHLQAILCSSDYAEHSSFFVAVATWGDRHIAQNKT
jgi:hypothetical protein